MNSVGDGMSGEKENLRELRYIIIISLLKEFPSLKQKIRKWMEENP